MEQINLISTDKTSRADKIYTDLNYSGKKPVINEFDKCIFKNCNFSNSNFSNKEFIDCEFENCDMSLIKITDSSFKNVKVSRSKLVGVDFSVCNDLLFSINFDECNLDYTVFLKVKMKKTNFKDCSIREANFTNADLSGSSFLNCDLSRSIFLKTNLQNADFSSAINFSINPEENKMKKAKFSLYGLPGLLKKYDIIIE